MGPHLRPLDRHRGEDRQGNREDHDHAPGPLRRPLRQNTTVDGSLRLHGRSSNRRERHALTLFEQACGRDDDPTWRKRDRLRVLALNPEAHETGLDARQLELQSHYTSPIRFQAQAPMCRPVGSRELQAAWVQIVLDSPYDYAGPASGPVPQAKHTIPPATGYPRFFRRTGSGRSAFQTSLGS